MVDMEKGFPIIEARTKGVEVGKYRASYKLSSSLLLEMIIHAVQKKRLYHYVKEVLFPFLNLNLETKIDI